MSDAVQIALISAISTCIPSLMAAFFAYRASEHARDAAVTSKATQMATNGITHDLVSLTARSSRAEGVLEGKQQEREDR